MPHLRSVLLLSMLGFAFVAQAAPKGHENKAVHPQEQAAAFRAEDRDIVRTFYTKNPSALPPGLAKKGKVPPGHAKKGAIVPMLDRGQVVTPEVEVQFQPLPAALEIQLPPPPHEVVRKIIGHDLVLINQVNKKIVDVLKDALP